MWRGWRLRRNRGRLHGARAVVPVSEMVPYTVRMRPICFISDYGLTDVLVGTCKGVMLGIAPGASIIDVTHTVPEFDVIRGGDALARHPVHARGQRLPGRGRPGRQHQEASARRRGPQRRLPGRPDNGLHSAAEALGGMARVVHLTNPRYHVQPVSSTFHGRDVFSPVSAHLAAGADLDDLGEMVDPASMKSLDFPGFRREADGGLAAEIINIDRFGNARLSVMQEDLDLRFGTPWRSEFGTRSSRRGT